VSHKGFSLVEVLVALTLIGIATVMFGFFTGSFSATRQARADTEVQVLARSYFDTLRSSWSVSSNYAAATLPTIKIPSGFSLTPAVSTVTADGLRRTVTLTIVTPQDVQVTFSTQISAP
jgi:prepilin-type N-terminal cleavage/methylation domain-containing protein